MFATNDAQSYFLVISCELIYEHHEIHFCSWESIHIWVVKQHQTGSSLCHRNECLEPKSV